jgi:hypothetical protein
MSVPHRNFSMEATFATVAWICVALPLGLSTPLGCVDVYEPFSARVDVWSISSASKSLPALDRRYSDLAFTRLDDGRLFLHATQEIIASNSMLGITPVSRSQDLQWDPASERFNHVQAVPNQNLPAGLEEASEPGWRETRKNFIWTRTTLGRRLFVHPRDGQER